MVRENQLAIVPNDVLFEMILFFVRSPSELRIAQLVNKSFYATVEQYQQRAYELFCSNAAKRFPNLPPPQDKNFKLHYLLHCLG